jgi:hypothetical protein
MIERYCKLLYLMYCVTVIGWLPSFSALKIDTAARIRPGARAVAKRDASTTALLVVQRGIILVAVTFVGASGTTILWIVI